VIGLTTGRQTTQLMNSLLNDLSHALPHAKIIRRGKSSLNDLSVRLLNENLTYAIALNRWHGTPGRLTLYNVQPKGITRLMPSIFLSEIKLSREYKNHIRTIAKGITCGKVKQSTHRFSEILSAVFEIPVTQNPNDVDATFHLIQINDSIRLVVTSPPMEREVGPCLTISRLLWRDTGV
jgi:rRNA maturation protein Rpf1